MIIDEVHEKVVEEESYFVSMTDMMVGLVFIFIIMLMYYALQFRDVTDQMAGANQTRTKILEQLEHTLKKQGVPVTIDRQNGVLRLPESILFDSARSELRPEGQRAASILANSLATVVPCYTDVTPRPQFCKDITDSHRVESIYVEGHTDVDPYNGGGALRDNWDLSVVRATNTYRALTQARPDLSALCAQKSENCEPILSVSGYGSQRPVAPGSDPESKRKNRRIDLRIIMVTPDSTGAVSDISKRIAP